MFIESKLSQKAKTAYPIEVKPSGRVTVCKLLQPLIAKLSITVTASGMTIEVKLLQL